MPCSLLGSLCHPPTCETFACQDQSWALAFLSNVKKKLRWAILSVYPGFPSLALCMKPLVGSVMSQQGADCSDLLRARAGAWHHLLCEDASILEGLFPCRKTRHGPINQSRNFPLLRQRRHNKQKRGLWRSAWHCGFLGNVFQHYRPTHYT